MKGDGLYKRPKSPFWYYKLKENGQWREVSSKTSNYQEAKKKRRDALKDQDEGRLPEGEIARWPFERAAIHYLQNAASIRLRPSSLKKEAFFLVRPKRLFGFVPCDRITAAHIQQLQADMKKDERKNTYNNLVLGATIRVLKDAQVWQRVRDKVKRLSERDNKPVARVLKPEEKKRLFEVASTNPDWTTVYAAALIATSTTARGADLRGLRWSDVDLFVFVMTIPDSKSEAGQRRVPLNSDARLGFRLLLDRANKLGVAGPESYVFPTCENSHIDGTRPQKTWRTSWRALTRAVNCPKCGLLQAPNDNCRNDECKADMRGLRSSLAGLRFHDLRHQCITELLEAGAPEAAVLSIAGHVSRKMMEHYSHIRMEAKRKAIEGLTPVAAVDSEVAAGASRSRVN
jgi:integrase